MPLHSSLDAILVPGVLDPFNIKLSQNMDLIQNTYLKYLQFEVLNE